MNLISRSFFDDDNKKYIRREELIKNTQEFFIWVM